MSRARAAALGVAVDAAVGEPPTAVHPVVWFGRVMGALERRCYDDRRRAGVVYVVAGAALGVAGGWITG